ncbi:MAG: glycosyltransferase family A protein [Bdellovibrionota bacterium]
MNSIEARLTSVMTCTADMVDSLPSAIESVLCQTDPNFELLVLDDGSSDGTWDYLNTVEDPRVRLFRFEKRQGLTAARNFLLAQCRGEFVSIADADDYLAPTKIERHASILGQNPRVGMVWGRALVCPANDGNGLWSLLPSLDFKSGWDLTLDYRAAHSATTWRTQLLRTVGGYDPRYTLAEAVDMFLKVGDTHEQYFSEAIATLKRVSPDNPFRTALRRSGRRLSRRLLCDTLKRRYDFTDN